MIKRSLSRLRATAASSGIVVAAAEAAATETGYLVAAATAEGTALQRIQLLPIGTFTLRDGRGPFVVADGAHAAEIVAASLAYAGRRDIPIDYDHQMINAIGPGKLGTAKASGWVKGLSVEADGVYADVQWTTAASAALQSLEYRYISPVFTTAKDGRVLAIRCAGLVNDNAIDELLAVASTQETDTVNYTKIAAALGLPATAVEDDILAAIGAIAMPVPADQMTAAATALGLEAGADLVTIVAAATTAAAGSPDPAKFVPVAMLTEVTQRLGVLEGGRHAAIIAAASEAGKLTPASVPWATSYIAKDEAGFNAWLAAAPVIVAAGTIDVEEVVTAASLTSEELNYAKKLRLTPEAFAAAKKG